MNTVTEAAAAAVVTTQRRLNITPADVAAAHYAADFVARNGLPLTDVSAESDLRLAFLAGAHYAFDAAQRVMGAQS